MEKHEGQGGGVRNVERGEAKKRNLVTHTEGKKWKALVSVHPRDRMVFRSLPLSAGLKAGGERDREERERREKKRTLRTGRLRNLRKRRWLIFETVPSSPLLLSLLPLLLSLLLHPLSPTLVCRSSCSRARRDKKSILYRRAPGANSVYPRGTARADATKLCFRWPFADFMSLIKMALRNPTSAGERRGGGEIERETTIPGISSGTGPGSESQGRPSRRRDLSVRTEIIGFEESYFVPPPLSLPRLLLNLSRERVSISWFRDLIFGIRMIRQGLKQILDFL